MGAELELAALAATGSGAFVSAAASAAAEDAWNQIKERVARLLGRGQDPRVAAARLEASRTEVLVAEEAGNSDVLEGVRGQWEEQLLDALRQDPSARTELSALIEVLTRTGTAAPAQVSNHASDIRGSFIIQSGSIGHFTVDTRQKPPGAGDSSLT